MFSKPTPKSEQSQNQGIPSIRNIFIADQENFQLTPGKLNFCLEDFLEFLKQKQSIQKPELNEKTHPDLICQTNIKIPNDIPEFINQNVKIFPKFILLK